jgi:hypothetical protein
MRHRKIYSQSVTIKNRKERFAAAALEDGRQTEVQARLNGVWLPLARTSNPRLAGILAGLLERHLRLGAYDLKIHQ